MKTNKSSSGLNSPQSYGCARSVHNEQGSNIPSSNASESSSICTRSDCYQKELKISTLTRQIDLCHDEAKNLRTILIEKKHELSSLHKRVAELEEENTQLVKARREEVGLLQQRMMELEASNAMMKKTRDSLQVASIKHDQVHLQVLQKQVDLLQKKNQDLMLELTQAKDTSASQQELTQLRMQNEKLHQDVRRLSQLQKKSYAEPWELELQYRSECERLRAETEVLKQQILAYTEDFQTERADRQRAQAALHKLEDEREHLQKTIAMLAQERAYIRNGV